MSFPKEDLLAAKRNAMSGLVETIKRAFSAALQQGQPLPRLSYRSEMRDEFDRFRVEGTDYEMGPEDYMYKGRQKGLNADSEPAVISNKFRDRE